MPALRPNSDRVEVGAGLHVQGSPPPVTAAALGLALVAGRIHGDAGDGHPHRPGLAVLGELASLLEQQSAGQFGPGP